MINQLLGKLQKDPTLIPATSSINNEHSDGDVRMEDVQGGVSEQPEGGPIERQTCEDDLLSDASTDEDDDISDSTGARERSTLSEENKFDFLKTRKQREGRKVYSQ